MWKIKDTENSLWRNSLDRRELSNERLMPDDRGGLYAGYDGIGMDREDSLGSALARYKRASNDHLGGSRVDGDNRGPSMLDSREVYDPYTRGSSSGEFRSRRSEEDFGSSSYRRRADYSPEARRRRSPSPGQKWSKERDSRSREYNRRSRSRSHSGDQRRFSSAARRDSRRRSPAPLSYKRRSPGPRGGSYRSSRSKDRESSDGRESSTTRNAIYLSQAPSNIVVIKNIPVHCGEEDIRQEVEVFGAPVKDIRLISKGGFSKDPDIQIVSSLSSVGSKTRGSSPSSSVWAYLEFLRLEDAQRWMEQSQGRLRIRGDWVEMMYDEPESVSSYSRDREYNTSSSSSSISRRRRRSRSPVSRSRSRSRSRRRGGRSPPPSERSSRSSRRMSPESGSRRGGDSYRPPKDWDCFNCNGRNYPRRLECYRCGVSREESEKSRTDLSLLQITSRPTKYLVIRELDPLTTDETLQLTLTRISPVFVRQAYVSRDPVLQVSNGYAYVELNNESEAEKLKTYLEQKKFALDSKRVAVHYSKSCGDEAVKALQGSTNAPTLYNEPKNVPPPRQNYENEEELKKNPLIQAAHSDYVNGTDTSRMGTTSSRKRPNTNDVYAPSSQTDNSSAVAVTETVNVNGQLYPVFPVPNTALYMYDQNSGYYYDPQTMLYYDANTRYYYNSTTQQFLYWDGHYCTYLPLSAQQQEAAKNQQQAQTDSSSTKQGAQESSQSQPASDASQLGENRGSISFSFSANAKKPDKTHNMAKKVREDMERWTKSINSLKKMEAPRPKLQLSEETSSNPGGANNMGSNSESSSTWGSSAASAGVGVSNSMGAPSLSNSGGSSSVADAAFAALEKRNMLGGIDQQSLNESPYDPNAEFKKVLLDPKPSTALSPFSGIRNEDHSSSNENNSSTFPSSAYQKPAPNSAVVTAESEEMRLTDWSKLACLLCQRQFKDRDTLVKHQKLSDLHKSNMEEHMKNVDSRQQSEGLTGSEDSLASMLQYRDRAKERREKHGISAPPLRDHEKATSSASIAQSAPEKPIGKKNVGNKLMQAMGWKEGEGLGRSKQGITAPISATVRDTTAGLGANVYTRDPNKTYAENARQALLSRIKSDM